MITDSTPYHMFSASTSDMSTSSSTPLTSVIFDKASGDFALISSDDTIFYVPRTVLQLSSKVFETMFKAATGSTEDSAPVRMQATSKELETVLKFAHPGHKNPVVNDAATLVDLLRIAKQYEMDIVLDNLREWLVKPRYENGVSIEPIGVREPLVSLVAAISFEFQDEARFALRAVAKCDLGKELNKAQKYDIPLSLMHSLYKIRVERVSWYTTKVMELSEALIASCQSPVRSGHSQVHVFGSSRRRSPSPPMMRYADGETAASNLADCLRWHYGVMKELEARPAFFTLKECVSKSSCGATSQGAFAGSEIKSTVWKLMEKWEAEASILESKFPELNIAPVGEV